MGEIFTSVNVFLQSKSYVLFSSFFFFFFFFFFCYLFIFIFFISD